MLNICQSALLILSAFFLFKLYALNYKILLVLTGFSFFVPLMFIIVLNKKNFFKSKIFKKKNFDQLKKRIHFGYPVSIWSGLGLLLPFLDRIFIQKYYSYDLLGSYSSVSELISRSLSFFIFPITMAIHPKIVSLWNANEKKSAIFLLSFSMKLIFGVIILSLLVTIFFGDYLFRALQFFFNDLRFESREILLPTLLAGLFWQLSFFSHKMLELNEKTFYMVLFISFSIIINLFGNIFFLPKYGIIATAITSASSAFSYFFLTFLYHLSTSKKYR